MSARIKVAIIDKQPIFRHGLLNLFAQSSKFQTIAEGNSQEDAVRIARNVAPDIILLDSNLTGESAETVEAIGLSCSIARTIVLTHAESEVGLTNSFKAGAKAYVSKTISGDHLIDIVDSVHNGDMYVEPRFASRLMASRFNGHQRSKSLVETLTAREEQVLASLVDGMTNKEIARQFSLAEKTIKHHMTSILQKLQARNRVEAAMIGRDYFDREKEAKTTSFA